MTTLLAGGGILLAGCADQGGRFPSLARRDIERVTGSVPVVPSGEETSAPRLPPPAGVAERLSAISATADAAHASFVSRAPNARVKAKAAAGAAIASDRWAEAQVALSDLESARSDTMFALADLDSMLATGSVEEADTGIPAGLAEIAVLRGRVAGLVAEEDAVLADLRTQVN